MDDASHHRNYRGRSSYSNRGSINPESMLPSSLELPYPDIATASVPPLQSYLPQSSSSAGKLLLWTRMRRLYRRFRPNNIQKLGFLLIFFVVYKMWSTERADTENVKLRHEVRGEVPGCIQDDRGECINRTTISTSRSTPRPADPESGLHIKHRSFYLDGKIFRIISGSFHYFRTIPSQWRDRLYKMKYAGLNTVMTYIPWNLHEQVKGRVVLTGTWDIARFLNEAARVGLYVIVRPGPDICAEWEYGGLPAWLLNETSMFVRSAKSDTFLKHVDQYFSKLLPLLNAYSHAGKKGPIIAFQLENEFGSYGRPDAVYLEKLLDIYKKHDVKDLIFTSDGGNDNYGFLHGSLPSLLKTANFAKKPKENLILLKKLQPDKPLMVTEFWSGWFDFWEEKHFTEKVDDFTARLKIILQLGASINFYMFVGGTNFGFWNGAVNKTTYHPVTTSYDYNAPVTESGFLSDKYYAIRNILVQMNIFKPDRIHSSRPARVLYKAYGEIRLPFAVPYSAMFKLFKFVPSYKDIKTMEQLNINSGSGQAYGWIVYRTYIQNGAKLEIRGEVRDRAQVFVNRRDLKTFTFKDKNKVITLPSDLKFKNTLEIFVENMGRVNFKGNLDDEHKGILGSVYLDGKPVVGWTHYPFEFTKPFVDALSDPDIWGNYMPFLGPAAYKGYFIIEGTPENTYLLMDNFNKGIVLINGFNLGRYWRVGPQRTLFVPAPLLKTGKNEIIIFDVHRGSKKITSISSPVYTRK